MTIFEKKKKDEWIFTFCYYFYIYKTKWNYWIDMIYDKTTIKRKQTNTIDYNLIKKKQNFVFFINSMTKIAMLFLHWRLLNLKHQKMASNFYRNNKDLIYKCKSNKCFIHTIQYIICE